MSGFPSLDPLLVVTAAGFIAVLLARAAWHKVNDYVAFTGTLSDYRILPESLLGPATVLLVTVEALLAVGLLWGETRVYAGIGAAGLLVIYALAMMVPLSQGRTEISCGCGGPTDHLSPALLLRNALLAGIAVVAAFPMAGRELTWVDLVSLPLGVLALWLILEAAEQGLQNAAYIRSLQSRLRSGS